MSEVEVYEHDLHRLILNFFTVHGFQESAEEFSRETGLERKEEREKERNFIKRVTGLLASSSSSHYHKHSSLSLSSQRITETMERKKKKGIYVCRYMKAYRYRSRKQQKVKGLLYTKSPRGIGYITRRYLSLVLFPPAAQGAGEVCWRVAFFLFVAEASLFFPPLFFLQGTFSRCLVRHDERKCVYCCLLSNNFFLLVFLSVFPLSSSFSLSSSRLLCRFWCPPMHTSGYASGVNCSPFTDKRGSARRSHARSYLAHQWSSPRCKKLLSFGYLLSALTSGRRGGERQREKKDRWMSLCGVVPASSWVSIVLRDFSTSHLPFSLRSMH